MQRFPFAIFEKLLVAFGFEHVRTTDSLVRRGRVLDRRRAGPQPCSARGDTRAEAIANIKDAIEGWLEVAHEHGFPIPEARYRPAVYAAR